MRSDDHVDVVRPAEGHVGLHRHPSMKRARSPALALLLGTPCTSMDWCAPWERSTVGNLESHHSYMEALDGLTNSGGLLL